ncbi:uncharacterized protein LOC129237620 [Anastrepha obliqua]|uniref:uncharacterized protein LOC129237620 n=1 Tax=Anastrepha obliqua TaxID=95512 RepID=UPI002408F2D6|nr:uncharacterized protein LOC129237620 [Anastrepha obliqua]
MTENKDKHATGGGGAEIAGSNNSNAQGQSTTAAGSSNIGGPKDKKNDIDGTVAPTDTQHEREKDKEPSDR